MRVATYTRISTDEAHQPYSLEAQAQRLAAYIASQDGWTLVREYSDQKSGATLDRPGLRKALTEAQAGRADLRHAITSADDDQRRQLVQALTAEVRVHGRDHIIPVFHNPADFLAQVRTLDGWVGVVGIEPTLARF